MSPVYFKDKLMYNDRKSRRASYLRNNVAIFCMNHGNSAQLLARFERLD